MLVPFKKPSSAASDEKQQQKYIDYFRAHKKSRDVANATLSYLESGSGEPVVFIHGNFSSSFTWRKVISILSSDFHCLAPDLLGMGESKVKGEFTAESFSFTNQRDFLDSFFETIVPDKKIILVVQSSGSIIGCDWACRNSDKIRGIVHVAGIFTDAVNLELYSDELADVLRDGASKLKARPEIAGRLLATATGPDLGRLDLIEYRRALEDDQCILAIQNLIRRLPARDGGSDAISQTFVNTHWLSNSDIPKLMIEPSQLFPVFKLYAETARAFPNQQIRQVDSYLFVQEQHPELFVKCVLRWVSEL